MHTIVVGTTPTFQFKFKTIAPSDLNTQAPPLGYIDALKTAYTNNGDGFHPNADGYNAYYVPKITAWMKTL